MADLLRGENNGVIVDVRPTDFRAGAESSIVYVAVNATGDWTKYKPTDEWQRRYIPPSTLGYDTNSCTNFSCMNSIELQIERMLAAKEIPQATIDEMTSLGYFDANGNVNFSDWYNAILSGTTDAAGNTLYGPWDAVRKYGVLPQSKGYAPNDFTSAAQWFASKPTAEQIALGQEFLTMFDAAYEWVDMGNLGEQALFVVHLKQAPLHVLVPTGSTWNDTTVANTGPFTGVNHAITLLAVLPNLDNEILDHYNPFVKNLAPDYYIPYALKGVITLKAVSVPPPTFHYTFNVNLKYGAPDSPEVRKLQEALQYLGFMKTGVFGPFGPQTKAALAAFQTAHNITDPDGQGTDFGPLTRSAMNVLTQ